MSGIYESGGFRVTLVSKNDVLVPYGIYAPDGSYRVCTDSTFFGVYSENGALRINPNGGATAYDSSGAWNGVLSGSVFYPISVTGEGAPAGHSLAVARSIIVTVRGQTAMVRI